MRRAVGKGAAVPARKDVEDRLGRELRKLRVSASATAELLRRVRVALAAGAVAWAVSLPSAALAEPYMALREGYACGDCHTNMSGGGMRNVTVDTHGGEAAVLLVHRGPHSFASFVRAAVSCLRAAASSSG